MAAGRSSSRWAAAGLGSPYIVRVPQPLVAASVCSFQEGFSISVPQPLMLASIAAPGLSVSETLGPKDLTVLVFQQQEPMVSFLQPFAAF